jgi:hypothetical protein
MADLSAHLTHDELDTPSRLREDGAATGRALERLAVAAVAGAPSLEYDAFPREVGKPEIDVREAAARLASALGLDLD